MYAVPRACVEVTHCQSTMDTHGAWCKEDQCWQEATNFKPKLTFITSIWLFCPAVGYSISKTLGSEISKEHVYNHI